MRIARFVLVIALAVAAFAAPADAETRVALVIGNGAYANAPKLPNPRNDATDVAAALRDLGFEVIEATDVDKSAFDLKLREFARALREARTALFFYAGHGMQVAGKNYAAPIDARLESAADLQVETIDIDQVLAVMQASDSRVSLVFIDACRDNPLAQSFARTLPATRSASVSRGLSPVDAGRGALIAFATAPNRIALDGNGQRNSPFTAALLRHIRTPGLDIGLVMRHVTADVDSASNGVQVPWMHASLTTDVVLAPSSSGGAHVPPPPLPPPASSPPDEIAWSLIKDTKDAGQLRRFLQKFPHSARRPEAEERLSVLEAPPVLKPSPPPIADAQKAELWVASAQEPNKVDKIYSGTVIWRLDSARLPWDKHWDKHGGGPGDPVGSAILGDVDFPDGKLKLTLIFQKNLDATLSASHTILVSFKVAPESDLKDVKAIGPIQMRRPEAQTGEKVAGIPVPINKNNFLIGLGPVEIHREFMTAAAMWIMAAKL